MNNYRALEQLLSCEHEGERCQCLRDGQLLSWGDWRHRVGQWRTLLDGQASGTWALYHPDAFEFSAALFGLWASGKVACVPGSNPPVITARLEERVAGFIGDFAPDPSALHLQPPDADAAALESEITLDPGQAAMEIFTSGSSGEPQAIAKQLYQLSEEVANLESLWGSLAEGAVTVATVTHHHIYGLLFRVLWPLAAGRCFDAGLREYLEELSHHPVGWDKMLVVSSPSHLSRIPEGNEWAAFQSRCRGIFSSGAPLSRDASLSARRLLGQAPIEVFGSSETGGIAWRQQAPDREVPWQPVPRVEIAVDEASGCLQIRSPYLPPMDSGQWYLTSDKVRLEPDGRFQLLGRADRIAKVEGKRVSLSEMEKRLESHPWVDRARVLVFSGKRTEMAAVVVLSKPGAETLAEGGRRAVNRALSEHLQQQFERPVLPRRWRYPAELPVDSQGKVTQADLVGLFAGTRQGRPLLPEIAQVRQERDQVHLTLRVPHDLFYFQGHFPVAPILPGVVQVQWAQHYGGEMLGFSTDFSHLEAVKFQHVLRPGQVVELELRRDSESGKLAFRYHSESGQHASGRIVNKTATV